MANNKIQIKRSTSTGIPGSLSAGELAYSNAVGGSGVLYIGSTDGATVVPIGGIRNPGILTANQSLVANATSYIDAVKVVNLTPTYVIANGATGTSGQVLVSGGASTNVYWGTGTSGANTQIQFNDSGVANAVSAFTFDKVSNTLFVSNTILTTTINAASHTVGTSTIANSSGVYTTTVNAASFTIGTAVTVNTSGLYTGSTTDTTTGTGATIANDTLIFIGNNTVNAYLTTTGLSVNAVTIANTTGVYTGIVNGSSITVGTSTIANSTGVYSGIVNGSTIQVGANFTANSSLIYGQALNVVNQTNTATLYVTTSANVASAVYANSSGVYSTGVVNAASVSVGTSFIANSTKVTFTGANIDATSAFLKVADAVVTGNLTVSGTVTTLNSQQAVVNDNIIELGYNNTTTDIVDTGLFSPAGNSTVVWYSGLARIAASSNSTAGYFKIFTSNTNPNTASTIDTTANTKTGFLQSYLVPYGTGGAFVANATNITITANSTVAVGITANTLALTTALPGTSGGTGLATIANNSLIFGNSTNGFNTLALGTSGYVLQSNGTAITYDVLDGGSF